VKGKQSVTTLGKYAPKNSSCGHTYTTRAAYHVTTTKHMNLISSSSFKLQLEQTTLTELTSVQIYS